MKEAEDDEGMQFDNLSVKSGQEEVKKEERGFCLSLSRAFLTKKKEQKKLKSVCGDVF